MTLWRRRMDTALPEDDRVPEESDDLVHLLRSAYAVQVPENLLSTVETAVQGARLNGESSKPRRSSGFGRLAGFGAVPALAAAFIVVLLVKGYNGHPNSTSDSTTVPRSMAAASTNVSSISVDSAIRLAGDKITVKYRVLPSEEYDVAPESGQDFSAPQKARNAAAIDSGKIDAFSEGHMLLRVKCSPPPGRSSPEWATSCFASPASHSSPDTPFVFVASGASLSKIAAPAFSAIDGSGRTHLPLHHGVNHRADVQDQAQSLVWDEGCGEEGPSLCWVAHLGHYEHSMSYPVDVARALHVIPSGFTDVIVDRPSLRNHPVTLKGSLFRIPSHKIRTSTWVVTNRIVADLESLPVSRGSTGYCPDRALIPYRLSFTYPRGERMTVPVSGASCNPVVSLPWKPSHGSYRPTTRLLNDLNRLLIARKHS